MKLNKNHLRKTFWALAILFVIVIMGFVFPLAEILGRRFFPIILIVLGIIFLILGILLIYLTYKLKIKGKQKWPLLLTGATPILALISVILHNLVYALMVTLGIGGDEAFFFILGLVVCPIVFLVSVVWSIVLMYKKR
jgi:hypothetical protein